MRKILALPSCVILLLLYPILHCPSVDGAMTVQRWGKAASDASAPPLPTKPKAKSDPKSASAAYAVETDTPPMLDGDLKDSAWAKAFPLSIGRMLDGSGNASQATEVRLLRDAKTLYLAFRCKEPQMDKLKGSSKGNDVPIWEDDSVEFFLSPEGGRNYFQLGVNVAGGTYDGQVKDGSWNSGIKAAATRGNGEFIIEAAVPLEKLTDSAKIPERWLANFNRNRHTSGQLEEFAWSPTMSGDSHVPDKFGELWFKSPPAGAEPAEILQAPASTTKISGARMEVLPCQGGQGVVRFDLSAIPKGAKVYRADLLIFRTSEINGQMDEARIDTEILPLQEAVAAGGTPKTEAPPLLIRGPWFDRLDATEAVRSWISGKPNGGFFVKTCPFWEAASTCLEVAYEGTPKNVPPQVKGLSVFHRSSQTFLVWNEIEDLVGKDEITWGGLKAVFSNLDRHREVRYVVYRSEKPISAETLHEAELIARVKPLSCWNANGRSVEKAIDHVIATQYTLKWGHWNPFAAASVDGAFGRDCAMERLVIKDGEAPLARATGIYVHTVSKPGKAYYAVITAIDGTENTIEFSKDNSATEALAETPASSEPVFQKEFPSSPYWNYAEKRYHYVRWEAPPNVNLPSQYYNWVVAVPLKLGEKVPLEVSLPRGGGRSYWRTQYRISPDSIILTPHDFPLSTWWYGYHESFGTLKSFKQGVIQNYTERRLLSFMDWVGKKWPVIDRNQIYITSVARNSGGPASPDSTDNGEGVTGALQLGIRYPEIFSMVLSGGGIPDYAGQIKANAQSGKGPSLGSFLEKIWGKLEWALKTNTGQSVWDELNLTKRVRELPARTELPLVTWTGKGALEPTKDFFLALFEKGHFLMASFGVYSGPKVIPVSPTCTWPTAIRQDVRKNMSMPAFKEVAGTATLYAAAKEASGNLVVSDGVKRYYGEFNLGFRWQTEGLVDEPDRYEITLFWTGRGGKSEITADLALRRLQKFKVSKDKKYKWELRKLQGEKVVLQQGDLTVGDDELIRIANLKLTAAGGRLAITPVP